MQIVLVGCGNVGADIAKSLSREGHNITVIDVNERLVKDLSDELDLMGYAGNGTTIEVLEDAGVKNADLLIAATDSDERNLLCCFIAKKAGTAYTIARVRNPEYKKEIEFIKEDLGLSLVVNPELAAAEEIARLLKFPTALEIDTFAKGRVELLKFEVTKESPLCGMQLKYVPKKLDSSVLICTVERGNEIFIPNGDFTVWEGDKLSIIASGKKAMQFFKAAKMNLNRVHNVMIVGGGMICVYLANILLSSGVEVKIIEKDKRICELLAERLPEAIIINGDGADKTLMEEEGILNTEGFVSLTNHDEENVMMSVYVKKVNPKAKLITKVHRNVYDDIISDLNIGSIINPKLLAAENVVKYVRAMNNTMDSNIETLYTLNAGKAEALEFTVKEASGLVDVPLMDLKLKKNVMIASIIRRGQVETPGGQSRIQIGDNVVVVTTERGFVDIKDILA
ncbi:trk system potassium uptake protein TrkA [Lachnospiraceae bacterium YSD2013]|nr:trk system potassium uptake protein TrkA [Lachnospiraceae bacterium YSD2013]